MVKGRMPRETNPVPGEIPGFVSNFDTTGNEDYERVSPHNPYPVGNYIKQGSLWVPVSNENPMPTQLTGSNVENSEFAVVFGRKIRNETETATIEVPKNVNSALIVLVIYGVTGIFNEGEGIRLISRLGINSSRTFPERDFYAVFSPYITDLRSNQVHAYTNFDVDEPSYFRNRSFITVKTILPTTIPIEIDIVGTFSSGEGIDCELYATFR